jgi:predicted MFS family arabinose efflux permease
MLAMFLYLTLLIQTDMGFSPLGTGVRFLPFTVTAFFASLASGRLTSQVPVRLLLGVGMALVAAGLLLMRGLGPNSTWTALLAGFIVAGGGLGLANPALASTAIGVVPPQRSGMASGINNTCRQVGIATGIAALGSIFESKLATDLAPKLAATPAAGRASEIAHAVAAGGAQKVIASVPPGQRGLATMAIHSAFADAMNEILLIGGIIAMIGAVLAVVLVRSSDFVASGAPEPAAAAAG